MAIKVYGFLMVVPTGRLMQILAAASFERLEVPVAALPLVSLRASLASPLLGVLTQPSALLGMPISS
jgi:hypothetical protein